MKYLSLVYNKPFIVTEFDFVNTMKEGLLITFLVVKYVLVTLISFHRLPKSTKSSIMCVVQ